MLPPIVEATAGSVASVVSTGLVYPLDTVTSRIQTYAGRPTSKRVTSSPLTVLRRVIQDEGFASCYAGLTSDLASTAIGSFILFYTRVLLKHLIAKRRGLAPGKAPSLTAFEEIILGSLCGITAKAVTMPLSQVVVRMQTSSEDDDKGPTTVKNRISIRQVIQDVYDEKGLAGLWSGFSSAALLTLNPSLNLYLFELFKKVFLPKSKREHPPALIVFLASSAAATLATTATYPLTLAKTRLQSKTPSGRERYKSIQDVLNQAYKQHRLRGIFTGLEAQLLKKAVESSLTMLLKDRTELFIVSLYRKLKREQA